MAQTIQIDKLPTYLRLLLEPMAALDDEKGVGRDEYERFFEGKEGYFNFDEFQKLTEDAQNGDKQAAYRLMQNMDIEGRFQTVSYADYDEIVGRVNKLRRETGFQTGISALSFSEFKEKILTPARNKYGKYRAAFAKTATGLSYSDRLEYLEIFTDWIEDNSYYLQCNMTYAPDLDDVEFIFAEFAEEFLAKHEMTPKELQAARDHFLQIKVEGQGRNIRGITFEMLIGGEKKQCIYFPVGAMESEDESDSHIEVLAILIHEGIHIRQSREGLTQQVPVVNGVPERKVSYLGWEGSLPEIPASDKIELTPQLLENVCVTEVMAYYEVARFFAILLRNSPEKLKGLNIDPQKINAEFRSGKFSMTGLMEHYNYLPDSLKEYLEREKIIFKKGDGKNEMFIDLGIPTE